MIATAYAQGQSVANGTSGASWMSFVPIALMVLIFYFLLIRPQQKKEKERKEMINNLKPGDRVITSAGIYGSVSEIKDDNIVIIKINNSTKVEFAKSAIQTKI